MTMLRDKYELLDLLHESETKTYRARQIPSGRQVLVHLWGVGSASAPRSDEIPDMIWKYLKATLPQGQSKVLDMGGHDTGIYLVTEFLPGFQSLDQWLRSQTAPLDDATMAISAAAAFPRANASPDATPATVLEAAPRVQAEQVDRTMVQTAPLPGPRSTGRPEPAGNELPLGNASHAAEATQISPALSEAVTKARDAWLAQKRPAVVPSGEESAGESTMIFRPPESPPAFTGSAKEVVPPAPALAGSGDSTVLLSASQHSPGAAELANDPPSISSSPSGVAQPGEFTSLFQSPLSGEEPKADAMFAKPEAAFPSSASPGEFTRIFQAPSPQQEAAAAPYAAGPSAAPGEFTRVFGAAIDSVLAGGQPQLGQPAASQVQPASVQAPGAAAAVLPAPAARRSILPWVIVVCVALAALGFYFYFFLRH